MTPIKADPRKYLPTLINYTKSEAEIVSDKTEMIFNELLNENSSLFSVKELFWLNYWINKPRFAKSIEYETRLFNEAKTLKEKIQRDKNERNMIE
jgi:hypothetical protein